MSVCKQGAVYRSQAEGHVLCSEGFASLLMCHASAGSSLPALLHSASQCCVPPSTHVQLVGTATVPMWDNLDAH